ncbi:GNAT family N-acetyltransferase [Pengzhenrongella sicca]|uniref:GNAT family N-acetyltransferase n=1 Tax=Pengzhenrongella sicca TaxID=2819238 RepID=A0A8A4ZCB7_9MICO|nr:GNAT family N-acetyltransferase [Pengzhenrongella sicca]QTE29572.1 GNAT family N-acetyltransferase [Pengzhenrongella sicca]
MAVTLHPLDADRLAGWLLRIRDEYAADLVTAGQPRAQALQAADESNARWFPAGAPTAGHVVFDVVDDAGERAGYLWIGPDASNDRAAWWVWDISIDPGRRGQGLGRATLLRGLAYARDQGARSIGLRVFEFNAAARGLYESLGFEPTSTGSGSIRMRKDLV